MRTLVALLFLSSPVLGQGSYEIVRVADGVYAALQPEARRFNDSNSVILINDRDVVVVDSQSRPAAVRELVAEIRKLTDKPVRYLVNTHWHGDHTQGNQVYVEEFPGVDIVGHTTQTVDVPGRAAPYLEEQIGQYEEGVAAAEQWLATGEKDGEELTTEEKAALPGRIERTRLYLDSLRSIEFVLPTLTVDDELVLHRGKRRIEILHFEAHTRGDLVLYLPAEKVLVTGDLLDDLPYGGHGYPSSWIRTLDVLEKLDFERVVPGHGPVQEGKAQLLRVRDFLKSVVGQVEAASAGGKTLEEVRESVDLSASRRALAGDDETAQRVFDAWLPELVERAYLENRGELDPKSN